MQPGVGRRFFAAFLALWFVMISTDGLGLHACQMHDGALAGVAHEMGGASAGTTMDHSSHGALQGTAPKGSAPKGSAPLASAGTMQHGAKQAIADDAPDSPDTSHSCTCLGHCCTTSPVAVASSSEIALTGALSETLQRPGLTQHEYVAAWVTFILPFATAPPHAVA